MDQRLKKVAEIFANFYLLIRKVILLINNSNKNPLIPKYLQEARQKCERINLTVSDKLFQAMMNLQREDFVERYQKRHANQDSPLAIPANQTISAPHMIMMTLSEEVANIQSFDTVLEIGTGSGYQAAVIVQLLAESQTLTSIERIETLVKFAKENLAKYNFLHRVKIIHSDGTVGVAGSKFDKIIVSAVGPCIPDPLLAQLKEGGNLIIPVAHNYEQYLLKVTRLSKPQKENRFAHYYEKGSQYILDTSAERLMQVSFVRLVGEHGY